MLLGEGTSLYMVTLCSSELHSRSSSLHTSVHSWDQGARPPIHRHIVRHQIMAGKSSLEQEFKAGVQKVLDEWERKSDKNILKCLWKCPALPGDF